MLNVTNKDKLLLSAFFAKNPDIGFEIHRFKTSDDREQFDLDTAFSESNNCIGRVFIRREYDGTEAWLYFFEDSFSSKVYKPNQQKGGKNETQK